MTGVRQGLHLAIAGLFLVAMPVTAAFGAGASDGRNAAGAAAARSNGGSANITLLSPQSSAYLKGGSEYSITWASNGTTGATVALAYTLDGTTWLPIAVGLPSNGSLGWPVAEIDRSGVVLKVGADTPTGPVTDEAINLTIDSTPPASAVTYDGEPPKCVDVSQTGRVAGVPFIASDNLAGVASVELWWRIENRGGQFAVDDGIYLVDPPSLNVSANFSFGATKEGTYEFFTVATDAAGNRESARNASDSKVLLDGYVPSMFLPFPEPGRTDVMFRPVFIILFTERMAPSDYWVRVDPPGPVPSGKSWSELRGELVFSFDPPLAPGTEYTITIGGGRDLCGKEMVPGIIRFRTAEPPRPGWVNLTGKVVDALTRDSLAGATIQAFYANSSIEVRASQSESTGEFRLSFLPQYAYRVLVHLGGYQARELGIDLSATAPAAIEIALMPEGARVGFLEGRVTAIDGTPIANARLRSEDGSKALTNATGAYSLVLRTGRHSITTESEGYSTEAFEIEVSEASTLRRAVALAREGRSGAWMVPAAGGGVLAIMGSLVVLFILGGEAVKIALLLLPVILYSRLKKEGVLDHFVRGKVYGFIAAQPGCTYTQILKGLKLANGTLVYHTYVLEREGLVKSVKEKGSRRFFPKEAPVTERGVVLSKVQRAILELVGKSPGLTQAEIRKALRIPHQNVSYNVSRLLGGGLLRAEWAGLRRRYFARVDQGTRG